MMTILQIMLQWNKLLFSLSVDLLSENNDFPHTKNTGSKVTQSEVNLAQTQFWVNLICWPIGLNRPIGPR